MPFKESPEGQTHYYGDDCKPKHIAMSSKENKIEQEFFDKLAEKLEEFFEKGEKCECGKRMTCRSKALAFNAYANIYLKEAIQFERDLLKKEVTEWASFGEETKEYLQDYGKGRLKAFQEVIQFLNS